MPSPIELYVKQLQDAGKVNDGFTLSRDQRELAKKSFKYLAKSEDQNKIKKETLLSETETLSHSVIKDNNGQLYAILGRPAGIEQGWNGTIKIAQNLKSGDFCLVKILKYSTLDEYEDEKPYKEMSQLEKRNMLFGFQFRDHSRSIDTYKYYHFMKIIPGLPLTDPQMQKALNNNPIAQCKFVLALLKSLEAERQLGTIHHDLHPGNILIDPETMSVTIIDFGQSLNADKDGYIFLSNGGRIANGADIQNIFTRLIPSKPDFKADIDLALDKELVKILSTLIKDSSTFEISSNCFQFNSIDLNPTIKQVAAYLGELQKQPKVELQLDISKKRKKPASCKESIESESSSPSTKLWPPITQGFLRVRNKRKAVKQDVFVIPVSARTREKLQPISARTRRKRTFI